MWRTEWLVCWRRLETLLLQTELPRPRPAPAPAPSVCDHLVSGGDLARLQAAPRQRGGDHEYRISNTTETPIFCLFPLNFRSFPVFVRQFQQTQFFPVLMRCGGVELFPSLSHRLPAVIGTAKTGDQTSFTIILRREVPVTRPQWPDTARRQLSSQTEVAPGRTTRTRSWPQQAAGDSEGTQWPRLGGGGGEDWRPL